MLVDYHVHVAAHGEHSYRQEWIDEYIEKAHQMGIQEIGFSEHDEFSHLVNLNLVKNIQAEKRYGINIKLGLEVDYIPGREEKIKQIIRPTEYDYTIGSVHFIEGWGFDQADFRSGFSERYIDDVYGQYAALMVRMVQSSCFDIVGHIDLIKIWGHRPHKYSALHYFEPVLKAIQKYGLAVEVNSAGLRKEVAELYPAADILDRMFSYDIPITFGSDAHHPEQIGEGLVQAYRSAWQAGYRYLVRFSRHQQLVTPLGFEKQGVQWRP